MKLAPSDVADFRRDGYARIERLIDDKTVETLRSYYGQLIRGEIDCGDDNRKLGGSLPK